MIVDKIYTYLNQENKTINEYLAQELGKLAEWSFKRQFMTDDEPASPGKLRLSAAGKCPRALAYAYHGYERNGKQKDPRSCVVFFQGDMVEAMIVQLARLAGCTLLATGLNQITVSIPIGDHVVQGHPDGCILHDQKMGLLEVKSMSSFSFERFEKGEIDEGYKAQVQTYLNALGFDWCCLVAFNKDSGVISERILHADEEVFAKAKINLHSVILSSKDNLPEPMYTSDEKGVYPWQCLYCSHWGLCRTNAEKVLVGKSYKLKEKKTTKGYDSDISDCCGKPITLDKDSCTPVCTKCDQECSALNPEQD